MTVYELPLLNSDEQYVGIAGDWHGNWRWAVACIDSFGKAGIKSVFQLGDFGIWPGQRGEEYLGKLRRVLEDYDMTLYVTLGNHEDYDQVAAHEKDEQGIAWFRHNIAVLPRVYAFTHRSRNFLSLGGAPSIDKEYRTKGHDWWSQEMISDADADLAIETTEEFKDSGGVGVMFAHDAPDGGTLAVQRIIDGNPQGWSRSAINYATEGRTRMNNVVYAVKPEVFLHGHYHVFDQGWISYGENQPPGIITSFNPDGMIGNIAIMDVDDIYQLDISTSKHTLYFENRKEITQ